MSHHARLIDLPGWLCPPRVRDIAGMPNSWGSVLVSNAMPAVASDELGYLWAYADIAPRFRLPSESDANPGGVLFWTPDGIGLWIHPKSYPNVPQTSRLDHQPDEWLPVATVAEHLPEWITGSRVFEVPS